MATLRIDLDVLDYKAWRDAFGRDAGGRKKHGARGHRIFQTAGNDHHVTVDIDFDNATQADEFLTVLHNEVWPSPEKAPAKIGTPDTHIIELVETANYDSEP